MGVVWVAKGLKKTKTVQTVRMTQTDLNLCSIHMTNCTLTWIPAHSPIQFAEILTACS